MILIDPRVKFVYASYFLEGLSNIFGEEDIFFSVKDFSEIKIGLKDIYFDHVLLLKIGSYGNVAIDFGDKSVINEAILSWSDCYAKINLKVENMSSSITQSDRKKIISIGPSFGILPTNRLKLLRYFLSNRINIGLNHSWPISEIDFIQGYVWSAKRLPIRMYEYRPEDTASDYVFHASSFYNNQTGGDVANVKRQAFIDCVKKINGVRFEGGLIGATHSDQKVASYTASNYLKNMMRSALVFNTPAAWGCHGWKLAEYMACGKAIISLPLVNDCPHGVVDRLNIHFVSSVDEIEGAVKHILKDEKYRVSLEGNARDCYLKNFSPEASIKRINQYLGV